MVRLPGLRRGRATPAPALPEGWPDWLPVEGGGRPRDIVPTHRFWDVVRLYHRSDGGDVADGWPDPVLPGAEQRSLCDVRGRSVPRMPSPTAVQARALLDALGTDQSLHALVPVTDGATAEVAAREWPVVDARHVQPDLAGEQVALVRDLEPADAATHLAAGALSHLWSDTWLVRCDAWGAHASSTLVAGAHGTAERLRQAGLDVLPIGHAYAWPPPCERCGTAPT